MDEEQSDIKWSTLAYHGTDYKIAQVIEGSKKFICHENPQHWLGDGIYFFLDEALAFWWANGEKKDGYGSEIKDPAAVKVILQTSKKRVLDLRFVRGLKQFMEYKTKFDNMLTGRHKMIEYRCDLFNYIFEQGIDIIVGCFDAKKKTYFTEINNLKKTLKYLKLLFNEVQICVNLSKQTDVINILGIDRKKEIDDKK